MSAEARSGDNVGPYVPTRVSVKVGELGMGYRELGGIFLKSPLGVEGIRPWFWGGREVGSWTMVAAADFCRCHAE